ncbi:hypothetical protein M3Y98_00773500 [Aphelenchoides besseyi]|nr:hypothetical protein M3Y98_00773500 [Aphelenchoides besseyi]KAI6211760.1 hypothetical protein M3Y96_00468700 [Aphelenchoides besseyi]
MWYAADQNTTVGDVKVMIRDSDSFPIDVELGLVSNICRYRQDLWFRGERLSDKLKLVDVGMKDESKMLLVMVACSTELF